MYKNYDAYPNILNVSDIQTILGIGRKQSYELIHSKQFHFLRIGRHIKISKTVLINWIEGEKNHVKTN